jgi:hypothetical protein
MYACPKCGNPNTHVERRPDGFCYCPDCRHRWKIGESQPNPTLFDRITTSPEVLAEKLVYCVPVPLFDFGAGLERWYTVFSPFDNNKYFRTKEEAIAATVEKLKEVCDE